MAFAEGTPDGVSQPGAYFVSDADDQASTLTLSVASLATQNTDNKRLGRPTDFLWKQDRRTTLKYGVTSMETLKTRLDTLEEEMDKFLSHAAMSFRDILVREGWPSNLAEEWSTTCLPYRIGQDTVRLYISLHQRLYSVALVDSWSVAKTELELHASKLATRRASAPSRLVAICEVYCYLRDAKKASWRTMQLMESRERALSTKVDEAVKSAGGAVGNKAVPCPKCHSCFHAGGRQHCPFKNLTDTKAAESMERLMKKLAKLAEEEE
jgi:hypothetical protein